MMRLRTFVAALVLVAASCTSPQPVARTTPSSDEAAPQPSRVVVLLVVDQLAAWATDERLPHLPPTGGFARLRAGIARTVAHAHAITDTAPGHAALFTGEPPARTHIDTNYRLATGLGAHDSGVLQDDDEHPITPTRIVLDAPSSSLDALPAEIPTVADLLEAASPESVRVSLSLKDRAALFGGGRHPTAVLWYEPSYDSFVTSTAFARSFPEALAEHAGSEAMALLRREPWRRTHDAFVDAMPHSIDAAPGEGELSDSQFGIRFDHVYPAGGTVAGNALRTSPAGDRALLALARDAIDRMPRAGHPFLLAISFSSNDYVGHVFGPNSIEALEELASLDEVLRDLFASLDARFGRDGYSVLLSADHGTVPMPEDARSVRVRCGADDPYERPCEGGRRLDPRALLASVLEPGDARFVRGIAEPYLVLSAEGRSLPSSERAALLERLANRLRATGDFRSVVPIGPDRACPEGTEAIVCASIGPGPGELLLVPARGAYFGAPYTRPVLGGGHGSPFAYDRRVPLFAIVPPAQRAAVEAMLGDASTVGDARIYFHVAKALLGVTDAGSSLRP